ncbi:MAG: DciA family protein [Bacteroidales bacterium]
MADYNTRPLKGVIGELMNLYGWKDKIDEKRALNAYEKCVEPPILQATQNIYIKNRVLHITLNSAAARNNFQYKLEEVKLAINQEVGRAILNHIELH